MDSGQEAMQTRAVEQLQQLTQHALHDTGIPKFYINGFVNGVGFGDAYIVLQTNGKTTAVINMSLATLKTLAQSLTSILGEVEEQLGQEVLTLQQIRERIAK
jgi:hypothetical protein